MVVAFFRRQKMSGGYVDPAAAVAIQAEATSNSTYYIAVAALIIAILAIIIIIVVAVLLYQGNSNTVNDVFRTWQLNSATASTNPQPWQATPNTCLIIPADAPVNYVVKVQSFTNFSTIVTSGRTSIFTIDNSLSANAVTVTLDGGSVQPAAAAYSKIAAGTVGQFIWIDQTHIQRQILGATPPV
jgi:hypothetical protein